MRLAKTVNKRMHNESGASEGVAETLREMDVGSLLGSCSRIVVTGGSGFVGRHLVGTLVELGKSVTVVDLAPPPSGWAFPPEVRFEKADLRDPAQVVRAMDGAEMVFHLAGNASGTLSVKTPRLDFEANALGTFNVAEAAISVGVRRLVYLSSASVYGYPQKVPISEDHPLEPFLPYGATKLSGELILRSFQRAQGLPVIIGRAFVVYGLGEDPRSAGGEVSQFLRWHLNDYPIPAVGDVDCKSRDFIHVSDLVASLLFIADGGQDGEVFNLGTGEEVSLRQLAEAIGTTTGQQTNLEADTSITDDSYALVANNEKLRALGFKPRVALLDGLSELVRGLGQSPELPSVEIIFQDGQREPLGRA